MIGISISTAISYLKNQQIVAVPTETVYGLAANALDGNVITKIFEAKNRPFFDPLIVHTYSVEEIKKYVHNISELELKLFQTFSPGPLTVLLPKNHLIPDITTAGLQSVGFRIPNHPLLINLLQKLDFPLAAPSANPFGYVSPTSAQHVEDQLNEKIPYILDGGTCEIGLESTIVQIIDHKLIIHRNGGIPFEDLNIFALINGLTIETLSQNIVAPGMLENHYATKSPLYIVENILLEKLEPETAILSYDRKLDCENFQLVLSPNNNLNEAAQNLFSYMRLLDQRKPLKIVTQYVPNIGLGKAINDRLKKASINKPSIK